MDLGGSRESDNVEDSRGSGGGRRLMVGGGLGTLAVALIAMLLGKDPSAVLNSVNGGSTPQQTEQTIQPGQEDEGKRFVRKILAQTEDAWTSVFQQMGKQYEAPKLKLFTDAVESGCGTASSQVGPFYCPLDSKVYLDLSFFNEMSRRFGAGGDFANAYVIAHEVGHHVQNLLGISDKVHSLQQRTNERGANKLSVMLELQADFFAGVWAHHVRDDIKLNERDIAEALNAASAIGDDKLQQQSQGYVVPDAFTHGTSEQRMYWFKKGWQTGDINQGDTFGSEL